MSRRARVWWLVVLPWWLAGCREAFAPVGDTTVLSVLPAGGATGVDPAGSIVVEFSRPMKMGMEQYVVLHQGEVTGPVVPGRWSWSADRLRLSFTPSAPLELRTRYTLHLGGGMQDAQGRLLDFGHCAGQHGGSGPRSP